jgi:hypothetical protein
MTCTAARPHTHLSLLVVPGLSLAGLSAFENLQGRCR